MGRTRAERNREEKDVRSPSANKSPMKLAAAILPVKKGALDDRESASPTLDVAVDDGEGNKLQESASDDEVVVLDGNPAPAITEVIDTDRGLSSDNRGKENEPPEIQDEAASNEAVAMEQPNDEVLQILSDLIEFEAQTIFSVRRDQRPLHLDALAYFWKSHPKNTHKFGRLYVRVLMCQSLAVSCSVYPYQIDDHNNNEAEDDGSLAYIKPMIAWDEVVWTTLSSNIKELRGLCVREDTTTLLNFRLGDEEVEKIKSCNINESLEKLSMFRKKYNDVMRLLEIQKILAPIRETLELAAKSGGSTLPPVEKEQLRDLIKTSQASDDRIKDKILVLFETVEPPVLKSAEELKHILQSKPFSLETLQEKLEHLLQKWNGQLFGRDLPTLVALNYRTNIEQEEGDAGAVPDGEVKSSCCNPDSTGKKKRSRGRRSELEELQEGRNALRQGHGEDPLEESRQMATGAARAVKRKRDEKNIDSPSKRERRKSVARRAADSSDEEYQDTDNRKPKSRSRQLYRRKSSAKALTFNDSMEEAEDDERVQLGELPDKLTSIDKRSPLPKTYRGPEPEEGVFDENGRVRKRRRWTEQEKNAVKAGVRKHGIGKWVQIKTDYGEILRNRSAVQIKDCWRTMERCGEACLVSNSESEASTDDDE